MNPTSVIIVAKREGLILPCFPRVEPDGYSWTCPACPTIVARISYGLMNGLWRCECGAEIEVCVDGVRLDLEKPVEATQDDIRRAMDGSLGSSGGSWNNLKRSPSPGTPVNVIPFPERITDRDKEFLEACNIALDDDGDEPA